MGEKYRCCSTCGASSSYKPTVVCPCGIVRCLDCELTCGHTEHVVKALKAELSRSRRRVAQLRREACGAGVGRTLVR
jgi:hypothetical protein